MNYSQLVQLYFDRSNALQWYWTVYVLVVGDLLTIAAFWAMEWRRRKAQPPPALTAA